MSSAERKACRADSVQTYITCRAFYLSHVTLPIMSCVFYSRWWDKKPPPAEAYIKGGMLNFLCININSCLGPRPQPGTLGAPVLHLICLASGSGLVYLEPGLASFSILKVHFKRAFSILIWGSQALQGFRERCPPDLHFSHWSGATDAH